MKRFQSAYKAHLMKQDQKVTLELRELVNPCFFCCIRLFIAPILAQSYISCRNQSIDVQDKSNNWFL